MPALPILLAEQEREQASGCMQIGVEQIKIVDIVTGGQLLHPHPPPPAGATCLRNTCIHQPGAAEGAP